MAMQQDVKEALIKDYNLTDSREEITVACEVRYSEFSVDTGAYQETVGDRFSKYSKTRSPKETIKSPKALLLSQEYSSGLTSEQ